ncbi:MAG: biotin synthase BioB [Nitrospinota bacterium]
MDYRELASRVLAGGKPTREEAAAILDAPGDDLLPLLEAAFRVRRHYFGRTVQIHFLINAKSGLCPEDCAYCSQSSVSSAAIDRYGLVDEGRLLQGAEGAAAAGSRRYCIAISGRGPTDREVDRIGAAVSRIKSAHSMAICCSLGLLDGEKARRLREAGVDRLNHNLNTSERFCPRICSTHTYGDRIATLRAARRAGLELCSGAIFGQGESREDIVDVCEALREIGPESIPVNFLHAIPGTPLQDVPPLGPALCLRILSLVRFFNPRSEVRAAGGREVQLRELQPLALYPANSIFVAGYLTTPGQAPAEAHRMIRDLGFEVDVTGEADAHPVPRMESAAS